MKIDFDTNDQNSSDSSPLPEGRYNYRVTKAEMQHSKNKGTPQILLWTKVVDQAYEGKTRKMDFYLTQKASWKLKSLLTVVRPDLATGQVEVDDIIEALNTDKPVFSAWTTVDGDFNDFAQFSTPTITVSNTQSTSKYSDLPL